MQVVLALSVSPNQPADKKTEQHKECAVQHHGGMASNLTCETLTFGFGVQDGVEDSGCHAQGDSIDDLSVAAEHCRAISSSALNYRNLEASAKRGSDACRNAVQSPRPG